MKAAILAIITAPPGFAVDLFGGELIVCRLKNGCYYVAARSFEKLFYDDPGAAVDLFLVLHAEMQLNRDEKEP